MQISHIINIEILFKSNNCVNYLLVLNVKMLLVVNKPCRREQDVKLTAIFHAVGGGGVHPPWLPKKKKFQLKILKFTNKLKNLKNSNFESIGMIKQKATV